MNVDMSFWSLSASSKSNRKGKSSAWKVSSKRCGRNATIRYNSAWAILCFNLAAPLVFICAIVLYALYERFTGAQLTDGVKLLLGGMVCAAGGMVYGARCFAGAIKTYPRS